MAPRSKHPDKKIAKGQKNFTDLYAKGYFLTIRDICFADVNGDSHLDVFMLNSPHNQWSRLWLGNGKGGFAEASGKGLGGECQSFCGLWCFGLCLGVWILCGFYLGSFGHALLPIAAEAERFYEAGFVGFVDVVG